MARLFTVKVSYSIVPNAVHYMRPQNIYECEFAGLHFSREREADLILWVRVAAQHAYGKDTQVIFLHTERLEQ